MFNIPVEALAADEDEDNDDESCDESISKEILWGFFSADFLEAHCYNIKKL